MVDSRQSQFCLLQLPDPCLLAVLRCCVDDPRSLFSAARAHSRLHQAAVLAASSIRAELPQQQQVHSMIQYLSNYGQHVSSIDIGQHVSTLDIGVCPGDANAASMLRELPHSKLQGLSSLSCSSMHLQLQPGGGAQGVLGAAVPLKQLRFKNCRLWDTEQGLAATLLLLTQLQHLSLVWNNTDGLYMSFPIGVQQMQQLTYLELAGCLTMQNPDCLRHVQMLTSLQDLRVACMGKHAVQASMMSGLKHLTRLQMRGILDNHCRVEPGALAGKTQLQHLDVVNCLTLGGSEGVEELLSHLQHMQQLTHLNLGSSLRSVTPSAAAYSALTASSKLQQLDISCCTLPAGAWQHMFPAGRQLLCLQVLVNDGFRHSAGSAASPDFSRSGSCCPGLLSLNVTGVQHSAELLAALQGLSGLQALKLGVPGYLRAAAPCLKMVCQLTGLKDLALWDPNGEGLLQLTQLKHLTYLKYMCRSAHTHLDTRIFCQAAPGDAPVWRQVLRNLSSQSDPDAQQAAAAAQCANVLDGS